jgi:hypothetical protein
LFIIGTDHSSPDSAERVRRVIEEVSAWPSVMKDEALGDLGQRVQVRPDSVVVEVCKSRSGLMYVNERILEDVKIAPLAWSLVWGPGFVKDPGLQR